MDHQSFQTYQIAYPGCAQTTSLRNQYCICYASGISNTNENAFYAINDNNFLHQLNTQKTYHDYQIKCEIDAKNELAIQLNESLQKQFNLNKTNEILSVEITQLKDSLKEARDELTKCKLNMQLEVKEKTEQARQLRAVLQNEENLIETNKKLLAEIDLLTESKKCHSLSTFDDLTIHKSLLGDLKHEFYKIDSELEASRSREVALTAINEMLLIGNEKRDETIAQYKKKLISVGWHSSSDGEHLHDKESNMQIKTHFWRRPY